MIRWTVQDALDEEIRMASAQEASDMEEPYDPVFECYVRQVRLRESRKTELDIFYSRRLSEHSTCAAEVKKIKEQKKEDEVNTLVSSFSTCSFSRWGDGSVFDLEKYQDACSLEVRERSLAELGIYYADHTGSSSSWTDADAE